MGAGLCVLPPLRRFLRAAMKARMVVAAKRSLEVGVKGQPGFFMNRKNPSW